MSVADGRGFNMVEARQDKTNQCGRMIPLRERIAFDVLKNRLGVEEYPRSPASMKFSWDNFRDDGLRVLARLDWCYLFPTFVTASRKLVSYNIMGNSAWSDYMRVELEAGPVRRTRWRMNTVWLDEAEGDITQIWMSLPPQKSFFSKLRQITRFYKEICKKKVASFREEELSARRELE